MENKILFIAVNTTLSSVNIANNSLITSGDLILLVEVTTKPMIGFPNGRTDVLLYISGTVYYSKYQTKSIFVWDEYVKNMYVDRMYSQQTLNTIQSFNVDTFKVNSK